MSDNVVEKETHCSISLTVESRHGLDPFGKVINDHNDVIMVVNRRRVIGH